MFCKVSLCIFLLVILYNRYMQIANVQFFLEKSVHVYVHACLYVCIR